MHLLSDSLMCFDASPDLAENEPQRRSIDARVNKMLLGVLIFSVLVVPSPASAQLFKRHSSREECMQIELQKHSVATKEALAVVRAYCEKIYEEIEIENITRKCNFNVKKAMQDGYLLSEIREYLKEKNPGCLKG